MKLETTLFFAALLLFANHLAAQTFTKIEPAGIANAPMAGPFRGVAWVDVDKDGDLDLSVSGARGFFYNTGNDEFDFQSSPVLFVGSSTSLSWGDVDQDGDVDCFYNRNTIDSYFFLNDGNGNMSSHDFTPQSTPFGWSASLGDWNNDGWLDGVWAVPINFNFSTPALFYQNNGGLEMVRIDSFQFTQETEDYTMANWIDFDDDGDQDLFFASGPVSVAKQDPIYRNMLIENGSPGWERVDDLPFATELQDGQCYNFVDTDLDGDRDMFLTNFSATPNRYYENVNGAYFPRNVPMIAANGQRHLGNCWGDLDNDGYEDVIITGSSANTIRGAWRNLGGHEFEKIAVPGYDISDHIISGLSLGDYDGDGDLDFFGIGDKPPVTALTLTSFRGLFRNDLNNSNHWVQFDLTGVAPSCTTAQGARVKVKATIGGQGRWLQREVSSSNTFQGHNALRMHFGLGQTTSIDSVVINWPSGRVDVLTDVAVDMLHEVTEGLPNSVFGRENGSALPTLLISPNPAKGHCTVHLPEGWQGQFGVLEIYDVQGRVLMTAKPSLQELEVDTNDYSPGTYFVSWKIGTATYSGQFLVK